MSEIIGHYTKLETALEKILFDKKLRLSPFEKVNDPKESKPWNVLIGFQSIQGIEKELFRKIEEVMKREWKVLCFTSYSNDAMPLNDVIMPESDADKKGLKGIVDAHFGPCYSRPTLWAHYADNHRGICLLFDRDKLDENIQRELKREETSIFSGKVNYDILPATVITECEINNDSSIDRRAREFVINYCKWFLRKTPDWRSETEYRWFVHNP